MHASLRGSCHKYRAFSVLELLLVIAVMAVMMSLILPAVGGFSSTAGRRGAVNILMNTFEQARVAALESGQTVYVGFADADFPVEEMRYAAFIVFREPTEEEANEGKKYIVLKKWTRLPKNIAFKNVKTSIVGSDGYQGDFTGLNSQGLNASRSQEKFPVISFNSSGAVEQPSGNSNLLKLYLYEGFFANGSEQVTRKSDLALFEQISLSRYTGRVQLDITATGS